MFFPVKRYKLTESQSIQLLLLPISTSSKAKNNEKKKSSEFSMVFLGRINFSIADANSRMCKNFLHMVI